MGSGSSCYSAGRYRGFRWALFRPLDSIELDGRPDSQDYAWHRRINSSYRSRLPLAKAIASLQELSAGRFILGVGVGWMDPEFRALGVPRINEGKFLKILCPLSTTALKKI